MTGFGTFFRTDPGAAVHGTVYRVHRTTVLAVGHMLGHRRQRFPPPRSRRYHAQSKQADQYHQIGPDRAWPSMSNHGRISIVDRANGKAGAAARTSERVTVRR